MCVCPTSSSSKNSVKITSVKYRLEKVMIENMQIILIEIFISRWLVGLLIIGLQSPACPGDSITAVVTQDLYNVFWYLFVLFSFHFGGLQRTHFGFIN